MDHSTRNLSVITLLMLAIFLGLNYVAQRAALADWGLVLLFLLLAIGVWFYDRVSRRGLDDSETTDSLIEPVSYEQHTEAIAIPESIQLAGPGESVPPTPPSSVQESPSVPSTPGQPEPIITAPPPAASAPAAEDHPPAAATTATTIEEKASPLPSAPATETHTDIAAQSPAGAWSPSVPAPEKTATEPVPTPVSGAAPEPVAPRSSTEKVPNISPKEASTPADVQVSASAAAAANPPAPDPNLPINAKTDKPDDLKIIEGIGPKMEKALHAAGITTFAMLAGASETQIREAIVAAGMRFAPTVPTWAEQASFAANGDFVGLEAFQKTLVAGRRAK